MHALSDADAYMLWFNFFLGLNFIFLCLKLIIIHYHTQKQRKIKFKPRKNLNHNIYADCAHTCRTQILDAYLCTVSVNSFSTVNHTGRNFCMSTQRKVVPPSRIFRPPCKQPLRSPQEKAPRLATFTPSSSNICKINSFDKL